ncbi:MAG TPA: inner membrane CreD family protein [Bryobacteraceae bacterium]|jgi:inner membrane protein involved in colicin E2 resistance|nr:inner membrane CreD family protein [Bryobacteraceae bacterium]
MVKRLVAVAFIFCCTSAAWMILGGTILSRTGSTTERLRDHVQSIWGAPHVQTSPFAEYHLPVEFVETVTESGVRKTVVKTRLDPYEIRPDSGDVAIDLQLENRRKGLLWYATYRVAFRGEYVFTNPKENRQTLRLTLPLPAEQAVYDDLQFVVNGRPATATTEKETAYVSFDAAPRESVRLQVAYRSQGLDSWRYTFGRAITTVENFHLRMTTNFKDIDFPDNTLAPTSKRETPGGWQLDWEYKNLLSGYAIAMTLPEKLQPGPLASEISFFAPVSLFFFFFLIFIVTTLRNIDLHPMNYFFLAAAFFAFHLLLAYLADHLDIHVSFAIAAAVSVMLVVSYLRLVVGTQFAVREAALGQIIYLVMFSYAFFFKGLTGLAITIGAILTLFVVMQITGRIRWSERFAVAPVRSPS